MRYSELCDLLHTLAHTPPSQLKRIKRLWFEAKEKLRLLQLVTRDRALQRVLERTERRAMLFLRSLSAARGPMGREWARLAELDAERFLDHVAELREYLLEHSSTLESEFRRAFFVQERSVDPYRLFEELRKAGALREHTWALLQLFSPRELRSERVQRRVRELAALLFELEGAGALVDGAER